MKDLKCQMRVKCRMKSDLIFVPEPFLCFGYKQKAIDPRDGLTLFGPYTREEVSPVIVGIIGTEIGRRRFLTWLKKIGNPIYSDDVARPYFPGLEAAFNFNINFNAITELNVDIETVEKYIKYRDGHVRVHNLVNTYVEKLIKYKNEEERSIAVWFVVIPDIIYRYGRPKVNIPKSEDNISTKLGRNIKKYLKNELLFDEDKKIQEAYEYEINFHNQLKAKLLEHGIITQIVKESTVAYEEIYSNPEYIVKESVFDSAKAWSISTALYYKVGGLPWKLDSVRQDVCYIGLVFKKMESISDKKTACCAAQMFLDSGDGMIFRGTIGQWYDPNTNEYHLSESAAYELLKKALETFEAKVNKVPRELFIHARTYFDNEEWAGFERASAGKSKIVGVRVRNDNTFKLYREFNYSIPRGATLIIDENSAFLWTKGFVPRLQTVFGLETPNPLSIKVIRGQADMKTVCKDILSLTKLNYNACIYGDGMPVTLRFADSIGEILTAGPSKELNVLTFKHYI